MVLEMVEPALATFCAGVRLTCAKAVGAKESAEASKATSAVVDDGILKERMDCPIVGADTRWSRMKVERMSPRR